MFFNQFIFPIKNVMIKNGIENPSEYVIMYKRPDPGFVAASAITDTKIGPVQGVQPAAKAIPIKEEPKSPAGLLAN